MRTHELNKQKRQMIMELRWHAHVENHVIKVLFERKFKVVQLTFYRLRHEDLLLEGFGMKKMP